jgi:hypothetical protein
MVLDEQDLRHRLASAAFQASAPRFTAEGVAGRIRRRRTKILGMFSASLLVVAAVAVAIPVALTGSGNRPVMHPAKPPFLLTYTVAVNGQSHAFAEDGSPPTFVVALGEPLTIDVGVRVPARAEVAVFWLGISTGLFSPPGRDGQQPAGMHPALAHTLKPLAAGLHTFSLTWTVPARLRVRTVLLVAGWTTKQQDTGVGKPVALLAAERK